MNRPLARERTRIRLVAYTDAATLDALARPALSGDARTPVIELARRSRLRGHPLSVPARCASSTTTSIRKAWSRARRALTRCDRARPARWAIMVCHLQDLDGFLPHLRGVDDLRLLWHPADVPDVDAERCLRRLEATPLGEAVGPHPVYFCTAGRPAGAADWRRSASCPVLGMLADTARRRRHRPSDAPTPIRLSAPAARGRRGLRLVETEPG